MGEEPLFLPSSPEVAMTPYAATRSETTMDLDAQVDANPGANGESELGMDLVNEVINSLTDDAIDPNEAGPSSRPMQTRSPSATTAPDAGPSSIKHPRRGRPYVEVPSLPVDVRSTYTPLSAVRAHLARRPSSHSDSPAGRQRRKRPGWVYVTSPTEEGSDEDHEPSEDGDDDDDGSASDEMVDKYRRRAGLRSRGKERRRERRTGMRTRASGNRSDSAISLESISDQDDEFLRNRPRRGGNQSAHLTSSSSHTMARGRGRPPKGKEPVVNSKKRRWRVESDSENEAENVKEEEVSEYDPQSEGEEEIDELVDELESTASREQEEEEDDHEEVKLAVFKRHRETCEKCGNGPADLLLEKALARKKKPGKRKMIDADMKSDEELARELEGWLECERCVLAAHWGCIGPIQKREVLAKFAEARDPDSDEPIKKSVEIDEEASFRCGRCATWDRCFKCNDEWPMLADVPEEVSQDVKVKEEPKEDAGQANGEKVDKPDTSSVAVPKGDSVDEKSDEPAATTSAAAPAPEENGEKATGNVDEPIEIDDDEVPRWHAPLLFRCRRCKLAYHYEHLKDPFEDGEEHELVDVARYYQGERKKDPQAWVCHNCREWDYAVDIIIAWRPYPAGAKEEPLLPTQIANYKAPLPRQYLVKWKDRSFRHVTWVPHQWLLSTTAMKLRRFLEKGPLLDLITDETMAARGDNMARPTIAAVLDEEEQVEAAGHVRHAHGSAREGKKDEAPWVGQGPPPDINAEASLPTAWSTIDRILDVMMFPPESHNKARSRKQSRQTRALTVSSDGTGAGTGTGTGSSSPTRPPPPTRGEDGIEPPNEKKVDIDAWEKRTGRQLTEEDAEEVADFVSWCYVKWDDLQYDQSCWDTPPPTDSPLYADYKRALKRYLGARRVKVPILTMHQIRQREDDAAKEYTPPQEQPSSIVGGRLMPFQMEGFQWLLYKHFKRQSCILADDMGLGKTIQVASFLGYLGSDEFKIYPALVVVPNSATMLRTITNWVREFEKWVPHVRVVPYYGEASSRKVIQQYELYHKGFRGNPAGLKAHIVLTTYDTITGSEFNVFKAVPRWEVLCIDEGQRLKSDSSLIFARLKQLNSIHRLLLTGTPLNNNLRELFNLLNFLDEPNFKHLEDLEARFTDLNESLVQELHEMIKPYILRRIKADVLKLPPKVEIIVPISLTPIQKGIYKSILSRNADAINSIIKARKRKGLPAPRITGGGIIKGASKDGEAAQDVSGRRSGKGTVNGVDAANGAETNGGDTNGETKGTGEGTNGDAGANGDSTPNVNGKTPNGSNTVPAASEPVPVSTTERSTVEPSSASQPNGDSVTKPAQPNGEATAPEAAQAGAEPTKPKDAQANGEGANGTAVETGTPSQPDEDRVLQAITSDDRMDVDDSAPSSAPGSQSNAAPAPPAEASTTS